MIPPEIEALARAILEEVTEETWAGTDDHQRAYFIQVARRVVEKMYQEKWRIVCA